MAPRLKVRGWASQQSNQGFRPCHGWITIHYPLPSSSLGVWGFSAAQCRTDIESARLGLSPVWRLIPNYLLFICLLFLCNPCLMFSSRLYSLFFWCDFMLGWPRVWDALSRIFYRSAFGYCCDCCTMPLLDQYLFVRRCFCLATLLVILCWALRRL